MRITVQVITDRKFGAMLISTTVTNKTRRHSVYCSSSHSKFEKRLNEEIINTGYWPYVRGNMELNYGEFSRWDM